MPRAQPAKMPVVEARQLPLVQALNNGKHRRVDEPDICVRVAIADLADATVVAGAKPRSTASRRGFRPAVNLK
jgi:hypothetical protein